MTGITHISATRLESPGSLADLFSLPLSPFLFSWNTNSIPHPMRYGLFLSSSSVMAAFESPLPAWTERNDAPQTFVSGLWEYDVGEIFISTCHDPRYQEFNLAPSGAWWSCLFSDYRTPAPGFSPPSIVTTWHRHQPDRWQAAIEIPFSVIKLPFTDVTELKLNVCGIQGSSPRHYLSAAAISTPAPDFHHRPSFVPLRPS